MNDEFDGIGGSYVLNKDGLREKLEGTTDKLDSPIESIAVEAPVKPFFDLPIDKEDK